ncbi:MAG TPA: acyl carrier protein [Deltaproteobacteria bacterium]|nr:acyl carrier protein [Deltaproteobacteria bacterium]
MSAVSAEDVREMVLDALNLREEYDADEIDLDGALFGDEGLGLDSLDALQLAVAMEEKYDVRVDEDQGQEVFRSVRSITTFINAVGA